VITDFLESAAALVELDEETIAAIAPSERWLVEMLRGPIVLPTLVFGVFALRRESEWDGEIQA